MPSLFLPANPETIECQWLFSASDRVVRKESKTLKEGFKATSSDTMDVNLKSHKLNQVKFTFFRALETINEEENVFRSSKITDSSKQRRYLPTLSSCSFAVTRNLNSEVSLKEQTGYAILQDWIELMKSVMALLDRGKGGFSLMARQTLLPHLTSLMQLIENVEPPKMKMKLSTKNSS